jgi:hypothetical protein
MRSVLVSAAVASAALLVAGCEVEVRHPHPEVSVQADVGGGGGPVFQDPGVTVVTDEPPPDQRNYVYDEGYPPGCYLYGGFYYYDGYRYPHDEFVNRYVNVNIQQHRYVNVTENRQQGATIVERQKAEYQKTGGHRTAAPARDVKKPADHPDNRVAPKTEDRAKPEERNTPERTTPARTTPERTTPERTTPERTTPERKTPERTTPEQRATPERATPERSTGAREETPKKPEERAVTPSRTAAPAESRQQEKPKSPEKPDEKSQEK